MVNFTCLASACEHCDCEHAGMAEDFWSCFCMFLHCWTKFKRLNPSPLWLSPTCTQAHTPQTVHAFVQDSRLLNKEVFYTVGIVYTSHRMQEISQTPDFISAEMTSTCCLDKFRIMALIPSVQQSCRSFFSHPLEHSHPCPPKNPLIHSLTHTLPLKSTYQHINRHSQMSSWHFPLPSIQQMSSSPICLCLLKSVVCV